MRQCGRAPLCSQTWVPRRSTGKGASTPEKHLALSSPVSELNAVGAVLMAAPSGQAESPVCKFGGNLNIRLVRHKLFFLNFQHLEPTPNFWRGMGGSSRTHGSRVMDQTEVPTVVGTAREIGVSSKPWDEPGSSMGSHDGCLCLSALPNLSTTPQVA